MILTIEDVRGYCNIKNTDRDNQIAGLIEGYSDYLFKYTNNLFLDKAISLSCRSAVFEKSSSKIVIDISPYEKGFRVGNLVRIQGAVINSGLFTISKIESNVITVYEAIEDEQTDCSITKTTIPPSLMMGIKEAIKIHIKPEIASSSRSDGTVDFHERPIKPLQLWDRYKINKVKLI